MPAAMPLLLAVPALFAAAAPMRVLSFGEQEPVAGLPEQIRIQLAGSGAPAELVTPPDAASADRMSLARAHASQDGAWVVWLEPDPGAASPRIRVFAWRNGGPAQVQPLDVREEDAIDGGRALAVKAADFVLAAAEGPKVEPAEQPQPVVQAPGFGVFAGVGAGATLDLFWPEVSVGASFRPGANLFEVGLFARAPRALFVSATVGMVRIDERAYGAKVLFGRRLLGMATAGAYASTALRSLSATGTSAAGTSTPVAQSLWAFGGGVELRHALVLPELELRLCAGFEAMGRRQRFTAGGEPVMDYGGVRPTASLSVAVTTP